MNSDPIPDPIPFKTPILISQFASAIPISPFASVILISGPISVPVPVPVPVLIPVPCGSASRCSSFRSRATLLYKESSA